MACWRCSIRLDGPDDQALGSNTLVFFNDETMVGRSADEPYVPGEASLALTLIPYEDLARYGLPEDWCRRRFWALSAACVRGPNRMIRVEAA